MATNQEIIAYYERGILGNMHIFHELISYGVDDHNRAFDLLAQVPDQRLLDLRDCFSVYPVTDYGWALLPEKRPAIDEGLTLGERGDVQRRQYQEDRPFVEKCREQLRERLWALEVQQRAEKRSP